jgi:Plasmid pRiA4b ORF-3-like protein
MSPASRGPRGKQNKKASRRADLTGVRGAPETCDCPACSGEDVDPAQMLGGLLDDVATLADYDDALDAELAGAAFVAVLTVAGDELVPAFVQGLIPQVEAKPSSGALALLLAIGSVASGVQEQVAEAASAAAGRLVAAGIPKPRWAGELAEPVRVGDCVRLFDSQETMSVLVAAFRRASRGHAFMIIVDEQDCGAAAEIFFLDDSDLPEALDDIRKGGRADGLDIRTQALDPAELRWYVEEALDARAVHDEEGPVDAASAMFGQEDEDEEDEEEDGPPYPVLALLVRARLAVLPQARRPAGARGQSHSDAHAANVLEAFASIMGGAGGRPGGGFGGLPFGRPAPAKLAAKRKKSDGPAPIYQIKVGLRGAKPPIWRRLLVPADVSLARLHDVIQATFGWDGGHMHVFETPYGDFGRADRELGHRADAPVTLEQVAPRAKDKVQYTYDFGDDWAHEIVVEKVLDRSPALTYPCCTGGRRAAPPDDCGGIWGYEELLEILADPHHPEHEERLEWLGLDDASQFDPAAFDPDEVNRALAKLR